MNDSDLLLALSLDRQKVGTMMAAAYVDEDGTATVHLLERTTRGWLNLTFDGQRISSAEMAQMYDDVVLTRFGD